MSDSNEAVMFFYEYPAAHFPRPQDEHITEVTMDGIQDMAVRTLITVFKTFLRGLKPPVDFKAVDWNSQQVMTGFTMFEKKIQIDAPDTLWLTMRRPNAISAFGIWMAKIPLHKL